MIADRLATSGVVSKTGTRDKEVGQQAAGSRLFDWAMALMGVWLIGGIHVDGWAHQHVPGLETFFTPWHALFYTAFGTIAVVLAGTTGLNHFTHGYSWRKALPKGYELSMVGVIVFMVGGVADMVWHTLLGIEVNVEALLSPSHLMLATGAILIITGPIRAAWGNMQGRKIGLVDALPMLLATTMLLSLLTFFTQYGHPFATTWAANNNQAANMGLQNLNQALAMMSTLFQSALLVGMILLLLRRWNLPFGSLTLMFGIDIALLTFMRNGALESVEPLATGLLPLVIVALLAGLVADGLVQWLKPSAGNVTGVRIVAFAIPVVLYSLYYLVIQLTDGIWWKVPLWSGGIFLAGIAGLLISFVAYPPALPEGGAGDQ